MKKLLSILVIGALALLAPVENSQAQFQAPAIRAAATVVHSTTNIMDVSALFTPVEIRPNMATIFAATIRTTNATAGEIGTNAVGFDFALSANSRDWIATPTNSWMRTIQFKLPTNGTFTVYSILGTNLPFARIGLANIIPISATNTVFVDRANFLFLPYR